jgi:uncharacterized protein YprB with RNaseH-like and TPR domain
MDLKDKLKYYQSEKKQILPDQEHLLDKIAASLNGSVLEKDTLPVLKIEKSIPFQYIDPTITSDNLKTSVHLPLLTKNYFPDPINLKDILIFDLETTGLAGGTGTYPFLMGFGLFEEKTLRIRQYFLPDFGREINAYLDLKKLWTEKNVLLTYNGKTFDYPLLRNRLILNRVDNPIQDYSHLDLLHLTRRLWKHSLPSCSLGTIEERIFCFNRLGDIAGSLIPQAYFTFLQTGDTGDIQRIVDHNQQDIVSLARLMLYLHQIENATKDNPYHDGALVSMFNIAVKYSDLDRIDPIIKSFDEVNKTIPAKSQKNYSLLLKRSNKWDLALDIWENLISMGEEVLFSCEEIAKYYEHRRKNLNFALDYTKRALDYLNIVDEVMEDSGNSDIRENFNRRQNRIEEKLRKK